MFADLDRPGGTGWHAGSLTQLVIEAGGRITNKVGTAGGSRPTVPMQPPGASQEQAAALLNYQSEYLEVLLAIERSPISTRIWR
jgi:hypothetical protein